MRKFAAAALALPVLALIYGPVVARRLLAGRMGVGIGTLAISGIVLVGLAAPVTTSARPPVTATPLGPAALAGSIEPHHGIREPVRLSFSSAMDAKSVASSLTVSPAADVALSWNAAGTSLTVTPKSGWKPATYYTVTIGTAALDRSGSKLAAPARAIFTTRLPTGGRISASEAVVKGRVPTGTTFALTFDGPVDAQAVQASFRIDPAVEGTFETTAPAGAGTTITFIPTAPLAPDTAYTVSLGGSVQDADGIATAALAPLAIRTTKGPSIVRFRPLTGTTGVPAAPRCRSASRRAWIAPRPRRRSAPRSGRRSSRAPSTGPRATLCSSSSRPRPCRTAPPWRCTVATTATDRRGTPINAPKTAIRRAEARASARDVADDPHRPRRLGRGRLVARRRDVLPAAHELHPRRRWVTSGGNCSSPGGSGIARY